MNLELVVRLLLIGVGLLFLILSFAGAILELAKRADKREAIGGAAANPLEGISKLIEALGALFNALAAAPLWLGLGGFGVLLILLGAFLPLNF